MKGTINIMNTLLFQLWYSTVDEKRNSIKLTLKDIINAKIGQEFRAGNPSPIMSEGRFDMITLLFKDNKHAMLKKDYIEEDYPIVEPEYYWVDWTTDVKIVNLNKLEKEVYNEKNNID